MKVDDVNYMRSWREKNPHKWKLIQLKWYYRNRKTVISGQSKAHGVELDAYDLYRLSKDCNCSESQLHYHQGDEVHLV